MFNRELIICESYEALWLYRNSREYTGVLVNINIVEARGIGKEITYMCCALYRSPVPGFHNATVTYCFS